jgi:hypothetical protein
MSTFFYTLGCGLCFFFFFAIVLKTQIILYSGIRIFL